MKTLTKSGAGVQVEPGVIDRPDVTAILGGLLREYRFAVLKEAFDSAAAAVELMGRFGPVNEAATRKDGAVVVAPKDGEAVSEVFRSQFALPLHVDGVLTGFEVTLVGIYCVAFEDIVGGRTFVSDALRALARVPPEHLSVLRERGVEGRAVDSTGYYRSEYEGKWSRFPAFKQRAGKPDRFNLGLPHEPGDPASWLVRVAGVEEELSDRIFASLRAALLAEDVTYYHDWDVGDLLLMDNHEVMHGREAFQGRQRILANIQVLAQ